MALAPEVTRTVTMCRTGPHHDLPDHELNCAARFREKTRDEWTRPLVHQETCYSPVLDIDEVELDPQLQPRQMVLEPDHHPAGRLKPVGYTQARISELRARGVHG